jgi:hypothetical protein
MKFHDFQPWMFRVGSFSQIFFEEKIHIRNGKE